MRQKGLRCSKLLSVPGALAVGAAGALALATSLLLRAVLPTRGILASLLSIWLLFFGQIVLISEILSELHALGSAGMLAGHVLLFGAALIVFVRAGRRRLAPWPDGAREALQAFLRESPGIALFAAAVGLLAAANLVFPFLYPPLNGDANAYHLPRAYYWIQLASARHFPTVDIRMNEMPPNASFTFAWILALSGGFSGLHVPQWTAGLALAAATAALARLAGAARAVAVFTGVLVLTWPLTILQMGSSQTDLLVAASGACAVFFGVRATLSSRKERFGDLAYFGLAFGLAAGTKLTFVFLLPALAIALCWQPRGERSSPCCAPAPRPRSASPHSARTTTPSTSPNSGGRPVHPARGSSSARAPPGSSTSRPTRCATSSRRSIGPGSS